MFNNRLSLSGFHWFLNLTVTSIWSLLTQSVLLYMQVFMKEADRGDQCVIDTLFSLNVWVFICNVVFVVSMADPLLWSLRQKDSISCTFLGSTKTIMSMRCAKNTILNTCVLVRIFFFGGISTYIKRGFDWAGTIQNQKYEHEHAIFLEESMIRHCLWIMFLE